MDSIEIFETEFEINRFPRQLKNEIVKKSNTRKHNKSCTERNILQKEKQFNDNLSRKHQNKELIQKTDGTTYRKYYCNKCNKEKPEPCRCGYVQWCGKECEWDYCDESRRLGIDEELSMPYDVLCDYHSMKYYEYYEYLEKH